MLILNHRYYIMYAYVAKYKKSVLVIVFFKTHKIEPQYTPF